MNYEFHPEALTEFEKAADYYCQQQPGLEQRFIDAVLQGIRVIVDAPDTWRVFDGDIRRVLLKVFPYAILYSIEPDRIYIIAVMHCHRKPGYWKERTQ